MEVFNNVTKEEMESLLASWRTTKIPITRAMVQQVEQWNKTHRTYEDALYYFTGEYPQKVHFLLLDIIRPEYITYEFICFWVETCVSDGPQSNDASVTLFYTVQHRLLEFKKRLTCSDLLDTIDRNLEWYKNSVFPSPKPRMSYPRSECLL